MSYSSDYRKIHGKLEIIYTDSDKSFELDAQVSGNALYSYPSQVSGGYLVPTVKALTMDGNSTMGGGHQLIGGNLVMGWWSDVASDENGDFVNPPWLKLDFIARPVETWTIIGDSKLNQYPIDFKLELFDKQGNIMVSDMITNNQLVSYQHKFSQVYYDVVGLKITIYKWTHPNAKAKILQCFDSLKEDYEQSELKQFEVVEELATDSEGVSYGINSNCFSVTIYNKERKFDQGYLKDLLLLDRKVTPFIGIENDDGEVEFTSLGTFYSDSWEVPQTDQWAKVKCYDRLLKFQKTTYVGYPYTQNVSLYDLAEDILKSAKLKDDEYIIDEDLRKLTVDYAFLGKQSVWDALQDVCNAGLCRVYADRQNRVIVSVEHLDVDPSGIEINPSKMFKFEKETKITDFSNSVEVSYTDINASETTTEVVYSNKITIDPHSTRTMIVDYSQTVKDAFLSYTPLDDVKLNFFQTSINSAKFELENTSDRSIVANVEITGVIISISTQTVVVQDKDSVQKYGEMAYKHPVSNLVQSYSRAIEIGEYFLRTLSQKTGMLKIEWRGDPALKLEDKFVCEDRFKNSSNYITQYSRFSYDGGLKQEVKAKEV